MSHRHWSVDAELHNGVQAKTYRNDPYRARGRVFYFDDSDLAAAPRDEMPEGTRHTTLWGRVSFVPYPATEFRPASPPPPAEGELVRVFVGQLPYFVTDMQLAWLCHTFGGGSAVFYPERIMKKQPNGERLPTGCIHAYAAAEHVDDIIDGLNKRALVDDTGVWHAATLAEIRVLAEYVERMRLNRALRPPNRPYDSMVVERALSTYHSGQGSAAGGGANSSTSASAPQFPPVFDYQQQHHHQNQQNCDVVDDREQFDSVPPPPPYSEAVVVTPPSYAAAVARLPPPPAYGCESESWHPEMASYFAPPPPPPAFARRSHGELDQWWCADYGDGANAIDGAGLLEEEDGVHHLHHHDAGRGVPAMLSGGCWADDVDDGPRYGGGEEHHHHDDDDDYLHGPADDYDGPDAGFEQQQHGPVYRRRHDGDAAEPSSTS